MSVLAFHPEHNRPMRKDVTGAFKPEAGNWIELHKGVAISIDCRGNRIKTSDSVLRELYQFEGADLDAVGFFCHGLRHSLQMGFRSSDLKDLAKAIIKVSKPDIKVALYACSCATSDRENLASRLRDALVFLNTEAKTIQVDGHHGSGHCTRRPFVRRYNGPAYSGGRWLVTPGSPFWRRWVRALAQTDARLKYPLVSIDDIESLLPAE